MHTIGKLISKIVRQGNQDPPSTGGTVSAEEDITFSKMVRIAQPTPDEITKFPREFAVFTQIPGARMGKVDVEVRWCCCLPQSGPQIAKLGYYGHSSSDSFGSSSSSTGL